jgi:hypothetical protein
MHSSTDGDRDPAVSYPLLLAMNKKISRKWSVINYACSVCFVDVFRLN